MIRIGIPLQIGIVVLACLSPFIFPTIITLALAFLAGLVFPPLSILLGVLIDLLYKPAGYWPLATIIGATVCLAALVVRAFAKTRIM